MKWTKITDSKPTKSDFYLVADQNDAYCVAFYNVTTEKWGMTAFYWEEKDIIAWSEFERLKL